MESRTLIQTTVATCAFAVYLAASTLVLAGTLTQSDIAPTIDGADIAQLVAGPVGPDSNLRSVFYQRPAQGQTFTTGSGAGGYMLNAITVQSLWTQTINTLFIDIGTIDGTVLTPITSTLACGGMDMIGGNYVTYTLDTPLHLQSDTLYGFNLSAYNWSESAGGFNIANSDGDSYDGGSLYISGLEPTNTYGYPDNNNLDVHTELDRVFHLDIGTMIPGDANSDGSVTEADAAILANNWLRTGDATWSDGDFDNDNDVDDADAAVMAANWQSGVAGNSAAVPEPGIIVLLAGVLISLFFFRRRVR